MQMQIAERFRHSQYTVRTKIFKVFGGSFDIYAPDGSPVLFASQKAFKLKEDIRLYGDKSKAEELLVIKARSIIDFGAAYDVQDPISGESVGGLKRKGWKSVTKDEWIVMDRLDNEIGRIQEDNVWLGVLRRLMAMFIINLIPQSYNCRIGETLACTFKQNFNPFVTKITVDFPESGSGFGLTPAMDKRLALAAAVLLCAIEGKQNG